MVIRELDANFSVRTEKCSAVAPLHTRTKKDLNAEITENKLNVIIMIACTCSSLIKALIILCMWLLLCTRTNYAAYDSDRAYV